MYEEAFVLLQQAQDLLDRARCAHEKAMMAGPMSDEITSTASSLNACPWCGSRGQHCDPRGTCVKCKKPWKARDWIKDLDGVPPTLDVKQA